MELDCEKGYEGRSMRKGSVSGLILNACPGSFVVSDFLLLRSSKQAGAFVVNLQNLPETELTQSGAVCVLWRMGLLWPAFWDIK